MKKQQFFATFPFISNSHFLEVILSTLFTVSLVSLTKYCDYIH